MKKFYFYLWLYWALRVITCSVVLAGLFAFLISFALYGHRGMVPLSTEVQEALFEIWRFWFYVSLNFSVLIALFRSVKFVFNRCFVHYSFKMLSCPKEKIYIEPLGYGDLVKFWRKWLMLLIWLSGSMMVIAFVAAKLSGVSGGLFEWFDVWVLYLFILASGYFSFMLIGSRCKLVKVVRC